LTTTARATTTRAVTTTAAPVTTTTTTPTTTTPPVLLGQFSCTLRNPCTLLYNLQTFGYYYPHFDPTKFVQCGTWDPVGGRALCHEMQCPVLLVWDQTNLVCNYANLQYVQPKCPGQRAVCTACLLASSVADCNANGYEEDCSHMINPVCETWTTYNANKQLATYSSRCAERQTCNNNQQLTYGKTTVEQNCKDVKCTAPIEDCAPNYTPVCLTCLNAVSDEDCTDRGFYETCNMNQPVCAMERIWSRDSTGAKHLAWNQRCAEAESCKDTWDNWPAIGSANLNTYKVVHRMCATTSCEFPTVINTIGLSFRINTQFRST
jgi:hypothetical protein